jgi:hypothetical protein
MMTKESLRSVVESSLSGRMCCLYWLNQRKTRNYHSRCKSVKGKGEGKRPSFYHRLDAIYNCRSTRVHARVHQSAMKHDETERDRTKIQKYSIHGLWSRSCFIFACDSCNHIAVAYHHIWKLACKQMSGCRQKPCGCMTVLLTLILHLLRIRILFKIKSANAVNSSIEAGGSKGETCSYTSVRCHPHPHPQDR